MLRQYINYIYTPLYDFTTGKLVSYDKLHHACLDDLELADEDRVLCVGVGTGNEIVHIINNNPRVSITGIDSSSIALARANKKAQVHGIDLVTEVMDARALRFENDRFDTVVCIHVTDFIQDDMKVTEEIIRVTKPNGTFVITYPAEQENVFLGISLIQTNLFTRTERSRTVSFLLAMARAFASIVYLPLIFRRHRKTYSSDTLKQTLAVFPGISVTFSKFQEYRDHIVYGKKL